MLEGEQYIINYVTVETLATASVTNETADTSGAIVLTANVTNETANASVAIVFTTTGAIFMLVSKHWLLYIRVLIVHHKHWLLYIRGLIVHQKHWLL